MQSLLETVVSTISKPPPGANNIVRRGDDADMQGVPQTQDSIRIEVAYPMSYGYQNERGGHPSSCRAFYISALPAADAASSDSTQVNGGERMRSGDGMYVCEYLISAMPRDTPIAVRVAMSDQRVTGSDAWFGGSHAQPPAGQRRTILSGNRQVMLTASQPRALLRFEMVYSGAR